MNSRWLQYLVLTLVMLFLIGPFFIIVAAGLFTLWRERAQR